MLDIAVDLCKNVIEYIITNKKIEDDKKKLLSEILDKISEVLENTAQSLKRDEYPHMNCAILDTLSKKLLSVISNYMSKEDAIRLSEVLQKSSQIERQFSVRNEPDTIPEIERSAGEFKAMSLLTIL